MLRSPLYLLLATQAVAAPFDERVRPFLTKHCVACHGPEKPKGEFRVDTLGADFTASANRDRWLAVSKRIAADEMPPKDKPRPPADDATALIDWVRSSVEAAEAIRRTKDGRVPLRRLNRIEYENTLRDLLGVEVDFEGLLPADTPAHGFDNVAEGQHVSSFLIERYLEAADIALSKTIANGPKPTTVKKRYGLDETHHVKLTDEKVFRKTDAGVAMFSSSPWQSVVLSPFYPPDRGRYRFRLSVSAIQNAGKPIAFRVDAGPMLMGTKNHLVSYFDAPADKATVIEFGESLEARSTIRIHPYGLAPSQVVHKIGADKFDGPGLLVNWVEVEGPLTETWPPASHRRIFGDLPQAPVGNGRLEATSKDPEADAIRIVRAFADRAFRRPATDDDLRPILALVRKRLAEKASFERAVRVGLQAVLVSPSFLFLRERPGPLDGFALASRLSYFLWSTMPDEGLLEAARRGKLKSTLRDQVERMLKDPKSAAFTTNFVGQWLALREIDATEPSHFMYPEYDDMLRASMVREVELFFGEVLANDLSLTNFVASDFAMLNGRLAKHYGIAGPDGWAFQKVTLPKVSHRGGVLTTAAVLKTTANGTTTSPVTRGAWVMDRILGTPPPRPPADVPAVEPDTRGSTTIREQLAKHRQSATCASCHANIDPPGFALESFDVIGGWRENYRTTGLGEPVMMNGKRMPYLKGPKVDPADAMSDGRRFKDIDEFKQLLLKDKDRLARSLAEKLLTYATGAPPGPADRAEVEGLVRAARAKDYGLRTLVHAIVQSSTFQMK